uniref:Uncharacterized protein n=1 Tax=Pipistrellus kuhlii TaxID=59472 RepID=A0A7J7YX60_PIPKU|nr:hypothetical protein mPipKuh1_009847 [Pipistrellus kuhlii]
MILKQEKKIYWHEYHTIQLFKLKADLKAVFQSKCLKQLFCELKLVNDLRERKKNTPLCPFLAHIQLLCSKVFPANHTYFIFIQLTRHLNFFLKSHTKVLTQHDESSLLVQFLFHDSLPFI